MKRLSDIDADIASRYEAIYDEEGSDVRPDTRVWTVMKQKSRSSRREQISKIIVGKFS
jgi:hypothetical protein